MIIRNIEQKVRLATYISIGGLFAGIAVACIGSFMAYNMVKESRKSIYILDQNFNPYAAEQVDMQIGRNLEYRTHINLFHNIFFTIAPDEKYIEYQMQRAMFLIDESGVKQYNNLKENGFYTSILSTSAVVTLQTDSIFLDEQNKYFRFYGKQTFDRRSSKTIRSIITEGYLHDMGIRSQNNGHGVLITRWKTLENKNISHVEKSNI